MSTRRAGLWHKAGLARIGVCDIELATRALRLVLCHRAHGGTRDRGLVIRAIDGDRDLFGGAVDG